MARELRGRLGVPDGIDLKEAGARPADDDRASRAKASDALPWLQQLDEKAKDNVWQFGQLKDASGVLKASFTGVGTVATGLNDNLKGLGGESGTLENVFRIVEATGLGAARALAQVALGGGSVDGVGGSGFIRASYGGDAGDFGSTPGMHPAVRRALGGGAGSDVYVGSGGTDEASGAGFTAGMRARNLGNIGYFHQRTAGLLGPSNSRDVDHSIGLFATQEDGIRAAANLALHKHMGGRHSAWDLIAAAGGWTPGALGPGASQHIAAMMGLTNRDDLHLDQPGQMRKFLHGLAIQEHGKAGAYYTPEMIDRALGGRKDAPTVSAPPPRRTSPGSPASHDAGHIEAAVQRVLASTKMQVAVVYDERHKDHVASFVTAKMVAKAVHPTSVGLYDNHSIGGTHAVVPDSA